MTTALTHSVNTYFAQVGEQLGTRHDGRVHEAVRLLQRPRARLPRRPDGAERRLQLRRPPGHLGFDVGRVAIGQGGAEGQDLATPLQMAEVAATVANGGKLMRPTFVQQVTDPDGRVTDKLDPQGRLDGDQPPDRRRADRHDDQRHRGGNGGGPDRRTG